MARYWYKVFLRNDASEWFEQGQYLSEANAIRYADKIRAIHAPYKVKVVEELR